MLRLRGVGTRISLVWVFRQVVCLSVLSLAVMASACGESVQTALEGFQASLEEAPVVAVGPKPDTGFLLVRAGWLLDGLAGSAVADAGILIRDGRVEQVGRYEQVLEELYEHTREGATDESPVHLDLRGYTVLPGLVDLHTHLMDRPEDTADLRRVYQRSGEEQMALGQANARATIEAGFTSVRNVGAYVGMSATLLRDGINRGEVLGPRMQVAGFYLTVPGGGGDLLIPGVPEAEIPDSVRMGVARGEAAFRQRAEQALDLGADVVKVIASGAVLAFGGVPGEPEMTEAELRAVVEVAHERGVRVAAHAHGALSIKQAILAGVDTIEHASLIDEEGLLLAKERGVALAMDVYNGNYIDKEGREQGWPAEFLRKNLETVVAQREGFRRGVELGVAIVFATDSSVYPHGDNAKQFEIMVEHGMTPLQAIQAATSRAAEAMGWEADVGALVPGRFGDLIAVEGDPLVDVTRLLDVAIVVKGGLLVVDRRGEEGQ